MLFSLITTIEAETILNTLLNLKKIFKSLEACSILISFKYCFIFEISANIYDLHLSALFLSLPFPTEYQVAHQQVYDKEHRKPYPELKFFPGGVKPFIHACTPCLWTGYHRFGKFLKGLASENRLPEIVHAVPTFFSEPLCLGVSLRYPFLQLAQGERFGVIFIFRFVTNHPRIHARKAVYAFPSGHVGTLDGVLCPGGIYHYIAFPPVSLFQ